MGISAQQLLQSDPEYLRRQMAQQEMQRLNPTGSAAGAIGALLGRGVSNLAGGRGFFDVNDAGLRRVSDVQGIMSSVPFDPENPAAYYDGVATALKQAGYGDLAVLALKESATARETARKSKLEEKKIGLEEERVGLTKRQLLLEEVYKDPVGSIERAASLAEDDPNRQIIIAGAAARIGEKRTEALLKQAQIDASKATAAKAAGPEVSESVVTEDGMPLTKKGGKYYKMDGTAYTGKIKKLTGPGEYDAILGQGAGAGAGAKKPPGERRPLGSFEPNSQQTTAPTEAAEPAVTKYTRSKGRGGSYIYTPSPRGLTMDEWNAQDR
jgi:hypothetical protein